MNQKTLIALNTVASYSRQAVRMVVGLLLTPFVLHKVGADAYGVFQTVTSMVGLMFILDLGISAAVTRYTARENALQDDRACQETWLTSLTAYLFPCMAVVLLIVPAAPWLAGFIRNLDASLKDTAVVLLVIAALMFALSFPANAYRGVLNGLQRNATVAAAEIAAELTRAMLLVLTLTFWSTDIVWVLVITAGATVGTNVALALVVHATCPWARFSRAAVRKDRLRLILGFSLVTFIAQIGYTLNRYMHRLIIGVMLGPAAVTAYFVAGFVRDMLDEVILRFTTPLVPVAAKYQATGDRLVLQKLMLRGSKYAIILTGLTAAPLAAFARPLLQTWMWRTPEYADLAPLMVAILIVTLAELTRGASHAMLIGMARLKLLAVTNVAAVFLDGGLAILLLSTTSLGLYALVVSAAAGVLVRRSIVTWHTCNVVGISRRQYLVHCILWPLVPAALAYLAGLAILRLHAPVGWLQLIASGCAAGLIGALFCWLVTLNAAERQEVASPVVAAWRRLRPR